jgi:FkbM family methyltransferase
MHIYSHTRSLHKIPYLLSSFWSLFKYVGNKFSFFTILSGAPTELKTKLGTITIQTPLDALIFKETVINDCYQLTSLKDPQVIVDIGAAYGDFSWYAKKLHPSAQVIAYEPDPFHTALLNKNIVPLGCMVKQEAVGGSGQIEMILHSDHTQSSAHTVKGISPVSTHQVTSVTLHDALKEYDSIDLVKIDCEGAEKEIFDHTNPEIFSKIKRFSIEYHEFVVPGIRDQIVKLLKKQGYAVEIKEDAYTKDFGFIYAKK